MTTLAEIAALLEQLRSLWWITIVLIVIFVASFVFLRRSSSAMKQVQIDTRGDVAPSDTDASAADEDPSSSDASNDTRTKGQTASNDESNSSNGSTSAAEALDDSTKWRCACEGGFLPPGMLKAFGGAEAFMRLGSGQCYHKQV